jgi:hypothetical protein
MSGSKSYLSLGSEVSTLKLTREVPMENRSIELQECVAHHDRPVIVGVRAGALFVYRVNDVMRPSRRKTCTNHMVEEISQVRNQSTKVVLKELSLKTFLICCFAVVHHPNDLFDVPV